jgi:hypothetical protein
MYRGKRLREPQGRTAARSVAAAIRGAGGFIRRDRGRSFVNEWDFGAPASGHRRRGILGHLLGPPTRQHLARAAPSDRGLREPGGRRRGYGTESDRRLRHPRVLATTYAWSSWRLRQVRPASRPSRFPRRRPRSRCPVPRSTSTSPKKRKRATALSSYFSCETSASPADPTGLRSRLPEG